MKFSNDGKDLLVLTENETEKSLLKAFLDCVSYRILVSDIPGQDWFGKEFFFIPLGLAFQHKIAQFGLEEGKASCYYCLKVYNKFDGAMDAGGCYTCPDCAKKIWPSICNPNQT